MGELLKGMVGKKILGLLVGSILIPFLAAKGIDLGIPAEQLSTVIWALLGLFGSHQFGQGIADGLSGGATSLQGSKMT
jgi:hypothetical protein